MKYDAIIFDIDGTLWDATPSTTKGWNKALAALEASERVTLKDIQSVTGTPFSSAVTVLLPKLKNKHKNFLAILVKYESKAMIKDGGFIYPGVISTVKKLSQKYKIFLVSNCPKWYLNFFLKFSKLKPYLTAADCFGQSKISKGKMIIRLKKKYKLEKPLYIGDTLGDLEAAREAKVDFVFVTYGFGQVTGKVTKINTFKKLLEIV